ncbi:hypothetical protein GOP47_0004767 [Adiantum capillus-veneris]|uniref:Phosphotransferase n=1 Tax=Adiantum capillus-veneris TaxID=13818 RepID=A0A9D4V432_ADICA|nr:hypothetical protein GOP47_0004767 [Adiantum capillus-veneris]
MSSAMLHATLPASSSAEQWSSRASPWMHASQSKVLRGMHAGVQRHILSLRVAPIFENSMRHTFMDAIRSRRKVGLSRVSMEPSPAVTSEVISRSDWNRVAIVLEELRRKCDTPADELLCVLIDGMVEEMKAGLAVEGGSKDYKMILTYVDKLPSGKERGHFYALDLGGTNFRVLRVHFGGKESQMKDQEYQEVSIPAELMLGQHEELFDFIAGKLAEFVSKETDAYHPLPGRKRELGFTFSFPIKQTSIDAGTLIKWTKGFAVEGTAGKDVVQALNEAMEKRGLDMVVTALVNDTVGTLAVASLATQKQDDEVMISVILGTGTNACYVESIDAIPKWEGPKPSSGKMIISMEWGGFSSSFLPRTQYDEALDAASVNPGEQIYEKLLSGMYLGDVVRRVLLRLAEEAALFGPTVPSKLLVPFILGTPHVSAMHQDESSDLQVVGKILGNVLGIDETSLELRKLVVDICSIVAKRAARLAGAGIVGILKKIGRDGTKQDSSATQNKRTVVAMDGGLYEHYPWFRAELKAAVAELLGSEVAKNVVIELSKDGSGIGAALLAAAHSRYGLFPFKYANMRA